MARPSRTPRSELSAALAACRKAFIGVALFSALLNILYLTGSFYMLEVYDRVLPSRSVPTLVGLVILAAGLYIAQGFLDLLRGRILGRIGTSLDEAINARVFDTVVRLPLLVGSRNEGAGGASVHVGDGHRTVDLGRDMRAFVGQEIRNRPT